MKNNIIETQDKPSGLVITKLECKDLLNSAKEDVENILKTILKGQIASNQHCYINLPHPLTVENFREAYVPIFNWGDKEIINIEALFSSALTSLGLSEIEIKDMKERANIIIREYRTGQHIPFHYDELECSPEVCGIILLNEDIENRGLCFQKGEGRNSKINYTVKEEVGSVFLFDGEARYVWQHGLPPVRARRISITCRFYKKDIINKWIKDMEIASSCLDKKIIMFENNEDNKPIQNIRITICDFRNQKKTKPIVIKNDISQLDLKIIFKNKLGIKVSKIWINKGDGQLREFDKGNIEQDNVLIGQV